MSALVFVADNGEAKPVMVKTGDLVIPFRHTTDYVPEKEELMQLSKDSLLSLLEMAGDIKIRRKDSRDTMSDKILERWETVKDNFRAAAVHSVNHVLLQPQFVNKCKSNDTGFPTVFPAKFTVFGEDNFVKVGDFEKDTLRSTFHLKPLTDKNSVLRFNGKYLSDRTKSFAEYGFRYHNVVEVEVYDTDDEDLLGILNGEVQYTYTGDFEDNIQVNVGDGEYEFKQDWLDTWTEAGSVQSTTLSVRVFESKGKLLLTTTAFDDMTVSDLKTRITYCIQNRTEEATFDEDCFALYYDGAIMTENMGLKNFVKGDDVELSVTLRLRLKGGGGGGATRVRKNILKQKIKGDPSTRASDTSIYENGFKGAEAILKLESVKITDFVKSLSASELDEVKNMLFHGRENNDVKLQKLADYHVHGKPLQLMLFKAEFAMEHLKEVLQQSIIDEFGGRDGRFMSHFKKFIEDTARLQEMQT